ncbi:MAG: hypothetical protein U0703_18270 [Anaerolineae bacterium]
MDDVLAVRVLQPAPDLREYIHRPVERQRSLAQQVRQRAAAQEAHRQVGELIFDDAVAVNWQDVDVFQHRNDRDFLSEALAEFVPFFLVRAEVDNFYGYIAVYGNLVRSEDCRHSAAPNSIFDNKVVNAPSDPAWKHSVALPVRICCAWLLHRVYRVYRNAEHPINDGNTALVWFILRLGPDVLDWLRKAACRG